ncbi:MAG TPA: MFS transporter [Candidatus Limnocylindrales bacterium]|nr:MFS transporter [Candidatus Limnocylindrales bacterium]
MSTPSATGAATPSVVRPAIVYAVLFGAVGAYVPYVALYYADLGLGLPAVGALTALNAAVALVAAPTWGLVVDRRRSVASAVVAASLWAAASAALLGIVREPLGIAVAVALLAAGSAAIAPLVDTRTVQLLGPDRDRFGRARASGSAAFIVIALLTGPVVDRLGAPAMFAVYVPLLVLTGAAALALLRGRERSSVRGLAANPASALRGVLATPVLGPLFLASVLLWTSIAGVIAYASIRLVELAGDSTLVGLLWSVGALVEVPLMFLFPAIARRTGAGPLVAAGALAFTVRAAGWALTDDPLAMLAIAPLGGVGFALVYVGTVSFVAARVPPEVQATAQGLFSGTAFSLGSIIGAAVAGAVVDPLGIPALFGVGAIVAGVAAAWIGWIVMAPQAPRAAPAR